MIRFLLGLAMFFKVLAPLLVFGLLVSGCDNNHDFKDSETAVSLDYDTACLDDLSRSFELYFDGLLEEQGIERSFNCLYEGIDYFQTKVKQERLGFYSLLEITNLFNRFLSDSNFSSLFYQNIFILKSQVFGGDKDFISNGELVIIKNFLRDLEILMKKLKPYAVVLAFGDGKISNENLDFSLEEIKRILMKWIFFTDQSFSEKSLVSVLIETSDNEDSAVSKGGESWYKVFDLLRSAKTEGLIIQSEKKEAVDKVIEVLKLGVKLNMSLSKDWLDERTVYLKVEEEINSVMRFVSKSLGFKTWNETDLMHFMRVFDGLGFLHDKMNLTVQKEMIRLLFDRYFPDGEFDGLGKLSKENFDQIILEWNFFKKFVGKTEQLESYTGSMYPISLSGQEPFERLTRSAWPVLVDKKDDILFVTDSVEEVEFSFRSLFHISWQLLAAKMLIRTYAQDNERAQNLVGLELLEVRDAYLDLFEVLLATEILDENSRGSWFRIFNEINLFIPSAEPDNYAGLIEATEYLSYLFSGINAGDKIAEKVEKFCLSFDKMCVEQSFLMSSEMLFTSMPTLSDYFLTRPSQDSLDEWFKSFEFIAKLDNNEAPYSSSLIFRGTIANQYVETIFRKFDITKDDLIDFKDSELAYGTFKEALKLLPQVKGTVAENDDSFLFGFFSFFIKEGRLPKFTSSGIPKREFTIWKRNAAKCQDDWERHGEKRCGYKVDRSRILALLAFLTGIEFVEEEGK